MATFPARLDARASSEVAASLGRSLVQAEHHPWGSKNTTWAVCELIDGRSGYEAAGPDLGDARWPAMAASMGHLLGGVPAVDVSRVRLSDVWTRPDDLSARAREWSAALIPHLSSGRVHARLTQVIDSVPLARAAPPVVCHGDFGPQNVLFDETAVTGLLDLEDARIGPPLLDVAWWTWLVRAHTPAAYERSWLPFSRAAGIDESASWFQETLRTLTLLRLLETADHFRLTQPEKYPSWATRIETELDRIT